MQGPGRRLGLHMDEVSPVSGSCLVTVPGRTRVTQLDCPDKIVFMITHTLIGAT